MSGRLSYTIYSCRNRTIYELRYKFGSVYLKRFLRLSGKTVNVFVSTRNISGDFLDFIERMFNVVLSARNISEDFLDLLERTFNEFVSGTYISDDNVYCSCEL